jgi:hypothetical protein
VAAGISFAAVLLAGQSYLTFSVLSTEWAVRLNFSLLAAFSSALLLAR